ncbi:MAG: pyruvate kinase [Pseudomonadota bacterium]
MTDRKSHIRTRSTKIVATLGPSSSSASAIRDLFERGVDVFRFNYSHGTQDDHANRMAIVRELEEETGRPMAVMADLQGPKLRVGSFVDGGADLTPGQSFRFDMDDKLGDAKRAYLRHPEIFAAISEGDRLLVDDGKVALRVMEAGKDYAETQVMSGTRISDRKGVNVPGVVLPISPLTEKDRRDLNHALDIGADWIALSFVQRVEDVAEARRLINGRAPLVVKMEKPSAIDQLEMMVEVTDAMMVARGDLGVEMAPERVPMIQKKMIRACREAGKPVIVATQMLESMINSPTATRAEASDVATAVFDGADAVMLSAETAAGAYPREAVDMMNRIAETVEHDPVYRTTFDNEHFDPENTAADAITAAARQVAHTIQAAAIVTYTTSGSTTLRAARERPDVPILCLTSKTATARRLALCWGVHSVTTDDVKDFPEMVAKACRIAYDDGLAKEGQRLVVTAGVPFGTPGNTNVLRIAWVDR